MQIRPATPEDAPILARALLVAGRAHVAKGIWEVVLGGTEEECLEFLQHITRAGPPHLFHYSSYLVAEDEDGTVLGSLGGYDPVTHGYEVLQQAIPEVVRKLQRGQGFARAMEERAARIMTCIPKGIKGAWVVDSVAVFPEQRGQGVASRLLEEILERGRSRGHSQAQVVMYIGNEPALKLYQKFGFAIKEEIRDPYFEDNIGSPGMLSLVKKL